MVDQAEVYEEQNVHEVYQQIAGHFSATRYKVSWKLVDSINHLPLAFRWCSSANEGHDFMMSYLGMASC